MANEREKALRIVYEYVCGSSDPQTAEEFVFHMEDWKDDLLRLAALYQNPTGYSAQEWKEAVDGVLLHACGHIMQAARLYGGLLDPFGKAGTSKKVGE